MPKTVIELYNSDKYQPVVQDAVFDKVQGQSSEIILSGDGRETSASGGATGSMTLNVSGGIWTDFGSFNTQQFAVNGSLPNTSANTVFTFNSNTYKSCFVDLLYDNAGTRTAEHTVIVVNGSSGTVERSTTNGLAFSYNIVNGSGTCTVQLAGAANATYKAIVRLL